MKKKIIGFLLAAAMMASLAGCATSNQGSEADNAGSDKGKVQAEESVAVAPRKLEGPVKMAYVNAGMNTYYQCVLNGLNEQLERYGGDEVGTVDVYSPTSTTNMVEEQISFLEALLQDDDLDVLFFSTHNDTEFIPYLEQFCEKGVSVYLFNMPSQDVTNNAYVSLVSYDFEEAGKLMGAWVKDHVCTELEQANMLYIEGVEGTHNTVRTDGFMKGVEGADNFEIVVSQSGSWTRDGGQTVTENALQSNPEINCVYGPYDEMPLGAIVALKDANKIDDVIVCGYDCTEDGLSAIRSGDMAASVNTDAKQMGNHMMDAVVQHDLEGKEIDKAIMNKLVVIDSTNADTIPADNFGYTPQSKSLDIER